MVASTRQSSDCHATLTLSELVNTRNLRLVLGPTGRRMDALRWMTRVLYR